MCRIGGKKRDKEGERQVFALGSIVLLSEYFHTKKEEDVHVVVIGLLYLYGHKTFLIRREEKKKEG